MSRQRVREESNTCGSLHHYTNGLALLNILERRTLWATNAYFLNDSQELKVGIELISTTLRRLARKYQSNPASPSQEVQVQVAERLAELVESLKTKNSDGSQPFVACFCSDGNLLSQWRSYGAGGYAIAFDPSVMEDFDLVGFKPEEEEEGTPYHRLRPKLRLHKVRYVDDGLEGDLLRELEHIIPPGGERGFPGFSSEWDLLHFLSRLKSSGFREESEYRLTYPLRFDRDFPQS